MKFDHYLKRIEESKEFKNFQKKNKSAYLCAGFFVLDFETGKDLYQLDYSLANGKIATFILDDGVKMKISDQTLKKKLPEIKGDVKTDLQALRGIVEDEMKNRTVTEGVKKMIAILHILDNKTVWNLQCILNGLGILQVHVDDADQSVLKFEKHSLMDFMKAMPTGAGAMPMQAPGAPQMQAEGAEENKNDSAKAQILAKIQEALNKSKQQGKKEVVVEAPKAEKTEKKKKK